MSGNGTLYTYTIARQPTSPHFASEVPQRLAVVELEEGVRLTTTLVNVADADIRIGMRLRPYFDPVADDDHAAALSARVIARASLPDREELLERLQLITDR